jgi:hypothetical protein
MTDKAKKRRKQLAATLRVSKRTAANIIKARPKSQNAPNPRQPMQRDVMVRRYGGVVDAHYVILRYDPSKGETLRDAVWEARSEAAARSDLLQAAIRRADQPGHPWVCQWTREVAGEPWVFEWMPGCDDYSAAPLALEARAGRPNSDWLATSETFPSWASFLAQLPPDELRCLRRLFDHDLGPLSPIWADVWDSLLVSTATALGFQIGFAQARDLLVRLTMFGVLRRNAHSTSETSPSFAVTDVFIASSKVIGSWFDLEPARPTDEHLVVLHALQVISTNLARFATIAPRMSAASRLVARAQLMGQLLGAQGRHPSFSRLFEQLRLDHNRACPHEARINVRGQADTRNETSEVTR